MYLPTYERKFLSHISPGHICYCWANCLLCVSFCGGRSRAAASSTPASGVVQRRTPGKHHLAQPQGWRSERSVIAGSSSGTLRGVPFAACLLYQSAEWWDSYQLLNSRSLWMQLFLFNAFVARHLDCNCILWAKPAVPLADTIGATHAPCWREARRNSHKCPQDLCLLTASDHCEVVLWSAGNKGFMMCCKSCRSNPLTDEECCTGW